jgi:hypothetical protein
MTGSLLAACPSAVQDAAKQNLKRVQCGYTNCFCSYTSFRRAEMYCGASQTHASDLAIANQCWALHFRESVLLAPSESLLVLADAVPPK